METKDNAKLTDSCCIQLIGEDGKVKDERNIKSGNKFNDFISKLKLHLKNIIEVLKYFLACKF